MINYTHEQLKSFVNGFRKASGLVKKLSPDHLLIPITGAVPFVDVLSIVDRHFDYSATDYMPNSSKFKNLDELMGRWFSNFLDKTYSGNPLSLVVLDEVVSGASALRSYLHFQKAIDEKAKRDTKKIIGEEDFSKKNIDIYNRIKNELNKRISYSSIGIQEQAPSHIKRRNKKYKKLVEKKIFFPVEVEKIITMDDPAFNYINLKFSHRNVLNRPFYEPEITGFNITPEYIRFLQDVAIYVGADPSKVELVNLSKIGEFKKYLEEPAKEPK
jgi:hypothetical protein